MQFSLFGYLYEVVDLTPAMQKASMSLAQKSIVSGGPGCDAEASFGTRMQTKQRSWTY